VTSHTDTSDVLPAKEPVSPVAGPYGHPFHPILVTIPIGAWVSSLVLDIASYVVDDPGGLSRAAYWLVGIGVLGAALAALFGLLDLAAIPRGTRAFRTGLTHLGLNLTVVGLFIASFFVRRAEGFYEHTNGTALALSVIALCLLLVSGWLGGMLAYHFGVRVARESVQADGFR
jgi:uncharacterized membrane protein